LLVADHAGELDSLVELTAEPLKVVEQRREVGADRDEAGEVLVGGFGGTASDRLRAASNPGAHLFLMGLESRYEGADAAIVETPKISDGRVVHLQQALQLLIIRHFRHGPCRVSGDPNRFALEACGRPQPRIAEGAGRPTFVCA
jgi:hypothetical protein